MATTSAWRSNWLMTSSTSLVTLKKWVNRLDWMLPKAEALLWRKVPQMETVATQMAHRPQLHKLYQMMIQSSG